MIIDLEALILARLAANIAPGSALGGTFDPVDLTDESAAPVVAQLFLDIIEPSGQAGRNARLDLAWTFSIYVDIHRASTAQKQAADALLQAAGNALTDWEISPGRTLKITAGQQTGFDGRLLRLSFGFTLPAFFAGFD